MSWSPSSTSSSRPVTVTVLGSFQVSGVNVSSVTSTPASLSLERTTEMVTSEVGWVLSITVTESVEPASETTIGVPATEKLGGVGATATSASPRAQAGLYRATKPSELPRDVNRAASVLGSKSTVLLK